MIVKWFYSVFFGEFVVVFGGVILWLKCSSIDPMSTEIFREKLSVGGFWVVLLVVIINNSQIRKTVFILFFLSILSLLFSHPLPKYLGLFFVLSVYITILFTTITSTHPPTYPPTHIPSHPTHPLTHSPTQPLNHPPNPPPPRYAVCYEGG